MKQEIVRIINSKCVGIKCEECNYKGKVLCESYYIADKIMNLFNDKEKVIQNEQIQKIFIKRLASHRGLARNARCGSKLRCIYFKHGRR